MELWKTSFLDLKRGFEKLSDEIGRAPFVFIQNDTRFPERLWVTFDDLQKIGQLAKPGFERTGDCISCDPQHIRDDYTLFVRREVPSITKATIRIAVDEMFDRAFQVYCGTPIKLKMDREPGPARLSSWARLLFSLGSRRIPGSALRLQVSTLPKSPIDLLRKFGFFGSRLPNQATLTQQFGPSLADDFAFWPDGADFSEVGKCWFSESSDAIGDSIRLIDLFLSEWGCSSTGYVEFEERIAADSESNLPKQMPQPAQVTTPLDRLLTDLNDLSQRHPDYGGTVELNDVYQLRPCPRPAPNLIEEERIKWDRAVRALDAIAPRVKSMFLHHGVVLPEAETDGAAVMAWVLQDQLAMPKRSSANAVSDAFTAIRESLLAASTSKETETENSSADSKVGSGTIVPITSEVVPPLSPTQNGEPAHGSNPPSDEEIYRRVDAVYQAKRAIPQTVLSDRKLGREMADEIKAIEWQAYRRFASNRAKISDDPAAHFRSRAQKDGRPSENVVI